MLYKFKNIYLEQSSWSFPSSKLREIGSKLAWNYAVEPTTVLSEAKVAKSDVEAFGNPAVFFFFFLDFSFSRSSGIESCMPNFLKLLSSHTFLSFLRSPIWSSH